nr:cytochrome B6-f complex subunit [Rhodella violacea]UNJ18057.1 cytochrome B6-f complex subunit [Rhodella violacea]
MGSEILTTAISMIILTLTGLATGFVLIRIEG